MAAAMIITGEEIEALAGAPHGVRALYYAMRARMDYSTGLVGARRGAGVSWRAFCEELYIEPGQGITDSGAPSKDAVRRMAARLERMGLIVNQSQGRRLVFRCLLARVNGQAQENGDFSARNNPATIPPQPRHSNDAIYPATSCGPVEGNKIKADEVQSNGKPAIDGDTVCGVTDTGKPATHRGSGVRGSNSEAVEHNPRARDGLAPWWAMIAALPDRERASTGRQSRLDIRPENTRGDPKCRAMVEQWAASGLSPDQVSTVIIETTVARGVEGKRLNYFAGAVADYLAAIKAPQAGRVSPGVRQGGEGANPSRSTYVDPETSLRQSRREWQALEARGKALGMTRKAGENVIEFERRVLSAMSTRAPSRAAGGLRAVRDMMGIAGERGAS